MYVRLAFATAINVNPDILLVDEALAVGDAVFQFRCIQRIKDLQKQGVTIFFVSHDLSAVKTLCNRALLLEKGRLVSEGEPYDVINQYQAIVMTAEEGLRSAPKGGEPTSNGSFRHGNGDAAIVSTRVLGRESQEVDIVSTGDPMDLRVRVRIHRPITRPVIGIMIRNRLGLDMYGTNTQLQDLELPGTEAGADLEVAFSLNCWLGAGDYGVTVAVHTADGISCDWIDDAAFFKVLGSRASIGQTNLDARASLVSSTFVREGQAG